MKKYIEPVLVVLAVILGCFFYNEARSADKQGVVVRILPPHELTEKERVAAKEHPFTSMYVLVKTKDTLLHVPAVANNLPKPGKLVTVNDYGSKGNYHFE